LGKGGQLGWFVTNRGVFDSRSFVVAPGLQAMEKRSNAVILSPFVVILSAAKNRALLSQGNCAKDRALSVFKAMQDSSARSFL
jgi:hypothetical protein